MQQSNHTRWRIFARCKHGESDADGNAQFGKARTAYLQMKNICNSTVCQLSTPKSEFSLQISRQFYCMEREIGELRNSSSRKYKCLLLAVYTKYIRSVGQTLSATIYCGREQTGFQLRKKSGRSAVRL
ncbi:unnamed protein product [Schistosoma mattheei]|uniref:Uncharacterized protein n=1 Tax=Schistosoma mattheei TaxID=31246 RepID=A0A183P6M7_9TREM|nr:unnamed protein product [Schistosoma mattheei]